MRWREWLILAAGLVLLSGCASTDQPPQYVVNWDRLKAGMPRLQVKELLGEPYRATYRKGRHTPYVMESREAVSERDQLVRELGGSDGNWSERWQYGKFGLGDMDDLFRGSDKAFIVDFDDWGRVMGFRRPSKGPFASQTQPGKVGP